MKMTEEFMERMNKVIEQYEYIKQDLFDNMNVGLRDVDTDSLKDALLDAYHCLDSYELEVEDDED